MDTLDAIAFGITRLQLLGLTADDILHPAVTNGFGCMRWVVVVRTFPNRCPNWESFPPEHRVSEAFREMLKP
jgi:hypothetical protein